MKPNTSSEPRTRGHVLWTRTQRVQLQGQSLLQGTNSRVEQPWSHPQHHLVHGVQLLQVPGRVRVRAEHVQRGGGGVTRLSDHGPQGPRQRGDQVRPHHDVLDQPSRRAGSWGRHVPDRKRRCFSSGSASRRSHTALYRSLIELQVQAREQSVLFNFNRIKVKLQKTNRYKHVITLMSESRP